MPDLEDFVDTALEIVERSDPKGNPPNTRKLKRIFSELDAADQCAAQVFLREQMEGSILDMEIRKARAFVLMIDRMKLGG